MTTEASPSYYTRTSQLVMVPPNATVKLSKWGSWAKQLTRDGRIYYIDAIASSGSGKELEERRQMHTRIKDVLAFPGVTPVWVKIRTYHEPNGVWALNVSGYLLVPVGDSLTFE